MPGVVTEEKSVTRLHFNKHLARKIDLFSGDAVALERSKHAIVDVSPRWIVIVGFMLDQLLDLMRFRHDGQRTGIGAHRGEGDPTVAAQF